MQSCLIGHIGYAPSYSDMAGFASLNSTDFGMRFALSRKGFAHLKMNFRRPQKNIRKIFQIYLQKRNDKGRKNANFPTAFNLIYQMTWQKGALEDIMT